LIYGLDANIAHPPFSALLSILLVVGCDGIGLFAAQNILKLQDVNIKWLRWQAPIIGVALIATLIYPLALAGLAHRNSLKVFAFLIVFVSLFHIYNSSKTYAKGLIESIRMCKLDLVFQNKLLIVFIALISGYALLALGPITSADSLDYHIGMPIEILNSGIIHGTPEWFHSRLAGNGEALNALGLAIGAEQFGSLLQFVGLVGIVALILNSENRKHLDSTGKTNKIPLLLSITALSTPTLVFLVASAKHQLLPIAMTTLAMCMIIYPSRRNLTPNDSMRGFSLICLLVMVAAQAKLNYFLSGGIVGLIALSIMSYKKLIWQSISIGILTAFVVFFPPMIIKSQMYGGSYVEALLTPLPGHWPGTDVFESIIRGAQINKIVFPLSLIFHSGIGMITTVIGIGVLSPVFLKPGNDRWLWSAVVASTLVFCITVALGPKNARSYLEPYFWILIVISLQSTNKIYEKLKRPIKIYDKLKKHIRLAVLIQSLATLAIIWYGVATLFPGALTSSWRDSVMSRSANGYVLMKWVDATLPSDAVFLTSHRSMALAPRQAVSLDWLNYFKDDNFDPSPYLDRIKEQKVTHLLVVGPIKESTGGQMFSDCLGDVEGSGMGFIATRNPFRTGLPYKAWLVEFDSEKLPGCSSVK
jgi:hypothetical protein